MFRYYYCNEPNQELFTLVQRIHLKPYLEVKDIEIASICLNRSEDKMIVSLNNN